MSLQIEKPSQPNADPLSQRPQLSEAKEREWGTRVFLVFLFLIACAYASMLIYHVSRPVGTVTEDDGIMEKCRQICLKYGLVSTGNVRNDAEAYLRVAQKQHLTEELSQILSESGFQPVASQQHPLLNQTAPMIKLADDVGNMQSLSDIAKDRPVVVVFYLGYGCSHCVAQLLALDKDLHYFKELGADVVAISADSPEHTTERFQEYGRFHFPVLSDEHHAVAHAWGVYQPKTETGDEVSEHGTFIVDRTGQVIWAAMGTEPFLDNKSLLHVIARSQGMSPSAQPEELDASR